MAKVSPMTEPYYLDPAFEPYYRSFTPGEVIFDQDGADKCMGILIEGCLKISRDGHHIADITEPGKVIGEISLILGTPHTATVCADGASEVILLPRKDFRKLAKKIPECAIMIMTMLAERLVEANSRLAGLEDTYDSLQNEVASATATIDTAELEKAMEAFEKVKSESAVDKALDEEAFLDGKAPTVIMRTSRSDTSTVFPTQAKSFGDHNPLLATDVICVTHRGEDGIAANSKKRIAGIPGLEVFPVYCLRTGSQRVTTDIFGLTEYSSAEEGFESVDYTLQEVHVCPICLFASSRISHFLNARSKTESCSFSVRRSISREFADKLEQRRARILSLSNPDTLFSPNRGLMEADVSYQLAIMSALVFFNHDPGLYSAWGFRTVVYYLKRAQVHRRYGLPEAEQDNMGKALAILEANLARFNGAQYFYAMFLLVALSLRLKTRDEAEKYLERFKSIRDNASGRLESKLRLHCDEYFLRAKKFMEEGE